MGAAIIQSTVFPHQMAGVQSFNLLELLGHVPIIVPAIVLSVSQCEAKPWYLVVSFEPFC